ncbi:unnamed protein product [Discula destructiva]
MPQIQFEHVQRALPGSRLPLFHTTGPRASLNKASSTKTHSFTVHDVSIHSDNTTSFFGPVRRFAWFVGALVQSDHVAFLANAPEIGLAFVQAVIPAQAPANTSRAPDPELHFFEPLDAADFSIRIRGPRELCGLDDTHIVPFVLTLDYQDVQAQDKADITLSLRHDYGGQIAAKHLAQLAAAYLNSEYANPAVAIAGLEPSRLNVDAFVRAAHQAQNCKASDSVVSVNKVTGGLRAYGFRSPRLIHTAFEDNVRRNPNNIAVDVLCRAPAATSSHSSNSTSRFCRYDLTYAELDTRANDLASELGIVLQVLESRWRPVSGDQYAFALFVEPSLELLITQLAVLKSGHVFCSLQADAPPERLRTFLKDLGTPAVLGLGAVPWRSAKGSQSGINQLVEETVWVDVADPASWRAGCDVPDAAERPSHIGVRVPTANDFCSVFYTSGSTGFPKGILGRHRAAVACLESFIAGPFSHFPAGPRLRWFLNSPPSFDPILFDTFLPLSLGGVACVAELELLLTDMEACARELRATATHIVSSLALLMQPEKIPELKTVVVGGETLHDRVVEIFAPVEGSKDDDRHLINVYGPTETTLYCTFESCTQGTRSTVVGSSIYTDSAFFLLADRGALDAGELMELPLGLAGELIIGGLPVAGGYLNRPEATARAFITADRFPELDLPSGTMLYRTGDLCRVVWSDDDRPKLEFLGRIDTDQVQLNGRRVELTEIETVLIAAQGVAGAAVVALKSDEATRTELVAFLSPALRSNDTERQDIIATCRMEAERLLPAWMLPRRYMILGNLPRTSNGKLDRKMLMRVAAGEISVSSLSSLLAVSGKTIAAGNYIGIAGAEDSDTSDVRPSPIAPSSIVDRGLVAALGDHVAGLDPKTSLLGMGLNSLRAMLLLRSARNDGVEHLSMHEVLSSTTVEDLTHLVAAKLQAVQNPRQTSLNGRSRTVEVKDTPVDVTAIAIDDDEAVYGLPVDAKLRHFSHWCFSQCASALNLGPNDIEQILPTTGFQTRMLYVSTRSDCYDPVRYSGRPHVDHIVYNVPSDTLDPGRFRRAVEVVLGRHDCFRAVVCDVHHPLAPFAMCILNKDSPLATAQTIEIVCKYDPDKNSLWQSTIVAAQRAAEDSINLKRPTVVVTWIRSPDEMHHVMVLTLYHCTFDGMSLYHLFKEIGLEYAEPGTKLPLLPMRSGVEHLLRHNHFLETILYWMNRFAGVPVFRMGPNAPVSGTRAKNPRLRDVERGPDSNTHMRCSFLQSSLSLDDLATGATLKLSTSLAAVVQAAWASVLAQTHKKSVSGEGETALAASGNGAQQQQPAGPSRLLHVQFGTIDHGRSTPDMWQCMAPLITATAIHVPITMPGRSLNREKSNLTNREICRQLAVQHTEAAPYNEVPCPTIDVFEMGQCRIDTALNVHAYRSEVDAEASADRGADGIGSAMQGLPGWHPHYKQNILPPYKELDAGFAVFMEVFPAFGPDVALDWRGKVTLKCTYNIRKPGYEFLCEAWIADMLVAYEEALVRILLEPDAEYYVG